MLDLFLSLIDRLIAIAKLRETDRQRLFKEIVEPLFQQVQPAVDDYCLLFRRARISVEEAQRSQKSLAGAVSEIRQNRERMLEARRMVVQLAEEIENSVRDREVAEFCEKVAKFFFSTQQVTERWSGPRELVELCDLVLNKKLDKGALVSHIDGSLRRAEESWIAIAQSYAHLRVRCLAPQRYLKS